MSILQQGAPAGFDFALPAPVCTLEYGLESLDENNVASALIVCVRKELSWKYDIVLKESLRHRLTSDPAHVNDINFLIQRLEMDQQRQACFWGIKGSCVEIKLQLSYRRVQCFDRLRVLVRQKSPCIIITSDQTAVALSDQQWWSNTASKYVLAHSSDGRIEMGGCPVYDISQHVVRDPDTQKEYLYHYELLIDLAATRTPCAADYDPSSKSRAVCGARSPPLQHTWALQPPMTNAYMAFVDNNMLSGHTPLQLCAPGSDDSASQSLSTAKRHLRNEYRQYVEQMLQTNNFEHISTLETFELLNTQPPECAVPRQPNSFLLGNENSNAMHTNNVEQISTLETFELLSTQPPEKAVPRQPNGLLLGHEISNTKKTNNVEQISPL